MPSRIDMQAKLEHILGSRNVYFEPPESVMLRYPCFVYKRRPTSLRRADDSAYTRINHYEVTYISKDPDSGIIDTMLDNYQMCSHSQTFTTDTLSHEVFDVYY